MLKALLKSYFSCSYVVLFEIQMSDLKLDLALEETTQIFLSCNRSGRKVGTPRTAGNRPWDAISSPLSSFLASLCSGPLFSSYTAFSLWPSYWEHCQGWAHMTLVLGQVRKRASYLPGEGSTLAWPSPSHAHMVTCDKETGAERMPRSLAPMARVGGRMPWGPQKQLIGRGKVVPKERRTPKLLSVVERQELGSCWGQQEHGMEEGGEGGWMHRAWFTL